MNMDNYEEPAVLVTCRSRLELIKLIREKNRNTPREELFRNTYFGHDIQIQSGREEFCLVSGLRFGVDYSDVYEEGLISFRRRVFDSAKDGKPIAGAMLEAKINSKGFEARHNVPDWILRLANDRDDWDMYTWGSYVWPALYYQLRNANVKRWQPLYANEQEEDDDDHTSYSLMDLHGLLSKNKGRNANVAAFNLGKYVVDDNVVDEEVLITGERDTNDYIFYEKADPSKARTLFECMQFMYHLYPVYLDYYTMGYSVPELFCRELVPHLYMGGYHSLDEPNREGWPSDDQMNAWIELLNKDRPHGARFTVAKSGTTSLHPRLNRFIIGTDPHIIGTLDGSTRPYPSWSDVDWVYMPINAGGNHWVTGAINLPNSKFYVLDSLHIAV
nr:phospholipase-like protein [Tanacetum cinerariifolium]